MPDVMDYLKSPDYWLSVVGTMTGAALGEAAAEFVTDVVGAEDYSGAWAALKGVLKGVIGVSELAGSTVVGIGPQAETFLKAMSVGSYSSIPMDVFAAVTRSRTRARVASSPLGAMMSAMAQQLRSRIMGMARGGTVIPMLGTSQAPISPPTPGVPVAKVQMGG